MLDGGRDIPIACGGVVELVEKDQDVAPRQLCNRLLHNWLARPGKGKGPHVLQIPVRQASQLGEFDSQVF